MRLVQIVSLMFQQRAIVDSAGGGVADDADLHVPGIQQSLFIC